MVLRSQGKHTEAEQYLRRSLHAAPDRAHVHSNLGNLLAHQQRHAEAIECYRSALAIAPDYTDAWYNLGTVALRTGDANTARDALERVVTAQPGIAKAWAALGHAYRALSNPDRSRHAYLQALRADARHRGAHHGLALLARRERELPTALQHIDRCLELSSTDAELHLSRGNILNDMGQHEAALTGVSPRYRSATRLCRGSPGAQQRDLALWRYCTVPGELRKRAETLPPPLSTCTSISLIDSFCLDGRRRRSGILPIRSRRASTAHRCTMHWAALSRVRAQSPRHTVTCSRH